ncbi:dimethylarginine dimethylaminohydrolase family protein [Algoriphagus marinus]|uniref:dimethylarginine dimethylaminohydrolase family protein n=1 Tax=Algoriphagus marinus TaxID=1925762 RepID=UPI00094B9B2B|nr:arginine deiminase family protein [Algoriphagus marinus]
MKTCHSDYGLIKSVILKPAKSAFESAEKIATEWEELNYLSAVDFPKSKTEYSEFQKYFEDLGAEVHLLPASKTSMDSIYCRDAALATDFGLILCNMGKAARKSEPKSIEVFCQENGIKVLGKVEAPGTCEGGDMCWLDEKTLAIGHTYRTNLEGIRQLRQFLEPYGIEVFQVELPHYKGPSDVFHLMSIISPLDKDLAMVYSPLMPIYFREELIKRGFTLVECPEEEFDSMGCNVLALAPRKCLIVKGNPISVARLKAAGCEVIEYEGAEISQKGCGGPTCLSRPLSRIIQSD